MLGKKIQLELHSMEQSNLQAKMCIRDRQDFPYIGRCGSRGGTSMRRWLYALPLAVVVVCFVLAGMVKNSVVHFDPGVIEEYMTSPSDFKESYRIEMELDETGELENDIDPC